MPTIVRRNEEYWVKLSGLGKFGFLKCDNLSGKALEKPLNCKNVLAVLIDLQRIIPHCNRSHQLVHKLAPVSCDCKWIIFSAEELGD